MITATAPTAQLVVGEELAQKARQPGWKAFPQHQRGPVKKRVSSDEVCKPRKQLCCPPLNLKSAPATSAPPRNPAPPRKRRRLIAADDARSGRRTGLILASKPRPDCFGFATCCRFRWCDRAGSVVGGRSALRRRGFRWERRVRLKRLSQSWWAESPADAPPAPARDPPRPPRRRSAPPGCQTSGRSAWRGGSPRRRSPSWREFAAPIWGSVERAVRNIAIDNVCRVAWALGVDPAILLGSK